MSFTNTDIYDISTNVNELVKRFVDDEDETTLALGTYGYLSTLESKKIQTAIMMCSELANEVFPSKAKLDKNIITHAIMQNINDINAVPAAMTVIIAIKESDIISYMDNHVFTIDSDLCKINLSDENEDEVYEFHFDYDIKINHNISNGNTVYSAIYDMEYNNAISDIDNPYLKQPYKMNISGMPYVVLQTKIHQVSITHEYNQIVSSNIVDNKTMVFTFTGQLADFEVIVTQKGNTYHITPIFEGANIDSNIEYWCYYIYINTNTVRIKFDRQSFIPSLNAQIDVKIRTTEGADGNFEYNTNTTFSITSSEFDYGNITAILMPNTRSSGGVNRKTIDELKKIIPKEVLSRGLISSNADLDNYFNIINTDTNRLAVYNKIDNQFSRIKYAYFLIKDNNGNIIPTNTIDIHISDLDLNRDGYMYILPAGTMLRYSSEDYTGTVLSNIGKLRDNEYCYMSIYTILISLDPIFSAVFLNVINEDPYLTFENINQDTPVQFICEDIHLQRNLLEDSNTYSISFTTTQSIKTDMGIILHEDEEDTTVVTGANLRAFIVFYMDKNPYRYKEINLSKINEQEYTFDWSLDLSTDNVYDYNNNIRILDLGITGSSDYAYGYLEASTEARIFLLAKFGDDYGRLDLKNIVPNLDGWSVTNVYEVYGGITFFRDYSAISNISVDIDASVQGINYYNLKGIPVIGKYYIDNDEKLFDFFEQMNYKKIYIDSAREILENSFEIDFKLFNTYGPSRTYYIDKDYKQSIGKVDLNLKFELELKSNSDVYTKDSIAQYIREYIENINDIGDLHINNMLSDIRNKYSDAIIYFDFLGFNDFDGRTLHLYQQSLEELNDTYIPPEFISVHTTMESDGSLSASIVIDTVGDTSY